MRRIFSRGSTLGIRAFAVAVLALGLIGGLYAGTQRHSDTLTAVQPAAADLTVAPEAIAEQQAQRDARARVAEVRQSASAQAAVVAQAQRQAQAKAEAARKTAAKAAADAARSQREAAAARASRSMSRSQTASAGGGEAPAVPVDCQDYSGNKQIGCSLLSWAGFASSQMTCLEPLWAHESGWNEQAGNQSSGAYGIPQALPGSKMAKYGSDWETNPVPQVKWGLEYIKSRYGTPCGAWSAFQSKGWY